MIINLPWPPAQLRPNSARRSHWRSNATLAKRYKDDCLIALLEQRVNRTFSASVPVEVDITFCPPSRRKYDRDGSLSAIKAGLDILAAHIGMDDDDFEPITLRRGDVIKGGLVVIILTEKV